MPASIVTLLTDYGSVDGYVAAMKGAILGINPEARIVDVTHETPAQDIGHAAFVLGTTSPFFPADAIHVAVVDPGVGTSRRALVAATPHGRFVVPDNGLLTYVAEVHLRSLAALGAGMSARAGQPARKRLHATLPTIVGKAGSATVNNEAAAFRLEVGEVGTAPDRPVQADLLEAWPFREAQLGIRPDRTA